MPPAKPEPGRDQEMVRRTQKLNVVFALSSIGLLLAVSLMVWADYDREWKKYQLAFNKLEVKLTEKQIGEALGKVGAERKKALDAAVAQGQQAIAAQRSAIGKAQADLDKLQGEWYAADQNFRFTKAKIDVARYEYEEAAHNRDPSAERKQKKLSALEEQWRAYRLKLEDVIVRRDAAAASLKQLEKARLDAERAQKEALGDANRLDEKLKKIEPGFVSFVRNLPVLDLANPSLKINQIMPGNLYDDVVFTPTPKVDRCTTCHLGIDKKGYEKEPQPFTTHPDMETYLRGSHPLEKIGCTACHQGRGRATGFVNAVHTPGTKKQEEEWGTYTRSKEYHSLHYWDLPMLARGHTESQCAKCHQGVVEVPKAASLNKGSLLIERYGCFGCHKIKGWEGLRKVGPDLTKLASKTTEEWIFRWIKEPKAFRQTRMPQIWDVRVNETDEQRLRNDVEANAVVAYLMEKSGRASYPPPPKGDMDAGRKAFEVVGCLGCHRIGDDKRGIDDITAVAFRTHGPNLDGSGSKLDAGWLYAWVKNPKAYWHETKMPSLRLSDKEAADITAYLMSLKSDAFAARLRPALDAKVRDTILQKEYLEAQLSVKDAGEKLQAMDDRAKTLLLGEKTIGRYGCFGCHTIGGFEKTSPIGVELTEEGSKLVERLDFGFEHDIPHTLPGWLHKKLLEPRVFDRNKEKKPEELLRMPQFHMGDAEAAAIVTAVLSFSKEQVPLAAQKQLSADEKYIEKGARLVRNLNCQGCHRIGAKGGTIQEVIKDQLEASGGDPIQTIALSPPLLWNDVSRIGEGARVHTPWLHQFLKEPGSLEGRELHIRPWLQIRMPTFDFTEEEANTLTRYFAALDKVAYPYAPRPPLDPALVATGKDLFTRWQCTRCHVVAGKLPNQEPANMAPDLAKVAERLRPDWIAQWLMDPAKIAPGTRMPANFPTDAKENAYPDVLGGDQQKQIAAVQAYLLSLGGGGASGAGR